MGLEARLAGPLRLARLKPTVHADPSAQCNFPFSFELILLFQISSNLPKIVEIEINSIKI
jgi:hypothetical protein